jgi:hypothetical protein
MMKLLGIVTIVIGTIAIAPSITLADNISENTQSVTQSSTIVGSGNLVITDTQQSSIGIQNSRRSGGNIS